MSEFINRLSTNPNRKRLLVESIVKENDEIVELIVNMERADDSVIVEGTPLTAEDLTAIVEAMIDKQKQKNDYAKAEAILDALEVEETVSGDFTLPGGDNVEWYINDSTQTAVTLIGKKVTVNNITEDTEVLFTTIATVNGTSAYRIFTILIKVTNDYYTVDNTSFEWNSEVSSSDVTVTSANEKALYVEAKCNDEIVNVSITYVSNKAIISFDKDEEATIIESVGTRTIPFTINVYFEEDRETLLGQVTGTIVYTSNLNNTNTDRIYEANTDIVEWVQTTDNSNTTFYSINSTNDTALYAKVLDCDYNLDVEVTRNGGTIIFIRAKETNDGIQGSGTVYLCFTVGLYTDSRYLDETHVGSVSYKIKYTYLSTDPID